MCRTNNNIYLIMIIILQWCQSVCGRQLKEPQLAPLKSSGGVPPNLLLLAANYLWYVINRCLSVGGTICGKWVEFGGTEFLYESLSGSGRNQLLDHVIMKATAKECLSPYSHTHVHVVQHMCMVGF